MKGESLELLQLEKGNTVVDATLGLGGHAIEMLKLIGESGRLIAFEQDERNLEEAKKRLADYGDRVVYVSENFRYLKNRIIGLGIDKIDAVFFDLGLSSPHVDEADRGFSFMRQGPLDMRFDLRNSLTASDVINNYTEEELARVIYEYAEERKSRIISKRICERRKEKPFETTTEFAEYVEKIIPKKRSKKGASSHPATKIFQAIRMEVNDEVTVLKEALEGAYEMLEVGGRIVVLSYHSLEDTVVKKFFSSLLKPEVKPDEVLYKSFGDPKVEKMTKKPLVPSDQEVSQNSRSRSAKLRAYKKIY